MQSLPNISTPPDVDRLVSPEIPSPDTEPELYDLGNNFMVHGPCGAMNPHCPCMVNGSCSKFYPKPLSDETIMNVNGYPQYRRSPNDGTTGPPYEQTHAGIVPYNPYLLLRYDAHINVEICTSIEGVE